MIRPISMAAVDNSAARLVPPHLMKPFFARQARRPNKASSVAMMIDVAKARNSSIEHPFRYQADYGWKGSVAGISSIALQMADFLAFHSRRYKSRCESAKEYVAMTDLEKMVFYGVDTKTTLNFEYRFK